MALSTLPLFKLVENKRIASVKNFELTLLVDLNKMNLY